MPLSCVIPDSPGNREALSPSYRQGEEAQRVVEAYPKSQSWYQTEQRQATGILSFLRAGDDSRPQAVSSELRALDTGHTHLPPSLCLISLPRPPQIESEEGQPQQVSGQCHTHREAAASQGAHFCPVRNLVSGTPEPSLTPSPSVSSIQEPDPLESKLRLLSPQPPPPPALHSPGDTGVQLAPCHLYPPTDQS